MATKKLTIELDADATKVKSKVKRALEEAGGESSAPGASPSAAPAPSAEKLSRSLEKAARGADALGKETELGARQIGGLVKGFAGIGVGMALSYAANNMDRGPARTAVEASGGAIQYGAAGAMMGGAAGPMGAAAGAVLGAAAGAGKVLFDKSSEKNAWIKDFNAGEQRYRESREWAEELKNLTDVGKKDKNLKGTEALAAEDSGLKSALDKLSDAMTRLKFDEKATIREIKDFSEAGELDRASESASHLDEVRKKIAQVEAATEAYTKRRDEIADEIKNPSLIKGEFSYTATDALAKVGASITGSAGYYGNNGSFGGLMTIEADVKRTNRILEEIKQNTSGFGSRWQ